MKVLCELSVLTLYLKVSVLEPLGTLYQVTGREAWATDK